MPNKTSHAQNSSQEHSNNLHVQLPHQPHPPIDHKNPSDDELSCAFKSTIAIILAFDEETTPLMVNFDDPSKKPITCTGPDGGKIARPLQIYEGKPLVEHALMLAQSCCFNAIYVLSLNKMVEGIVERLSKGFDTPCHMVHFSHEDAFASLDAHLSSASDSTATFEVIGVTKTVLDLCAELAAQNPGSERVMLLRSDGVRLTPWHLLQLSNKLDSDPDAEIVTSWITWLRRLPVLFTLDFVNDIDSRKLNAKDPEHGCLGRPLPNLPLIDMVYGEERLESNITVPSNVEKFMREHTISALEAVRIAKRMQVSSNQDSTKQEGLEETLDCKNDADKLLIKEACTTIRHRSDMFDNNTDLVEEVYAADKLGKREREHFPIFADKRYAGKLAYLDSAATSQRLGCALDAEYRFNAYENANIYRGAYKLSAEATSTYNEARAAIEHFINADRRQTIMTMNATAGLNLVAQAWGEHNIYAGDIIVTALNEHHSNILPWMLLAQRKGAILKYIGIRSDGTLDMDEYAELLKLKPKLVCIAQISNVIGIRNPVEQMAKMAHGAGARIAVDAAQSAPHIPIDVKSLGADFIAFSGHKLYGPFGIGCLWVSPDAFKEMDPLGGGGGTVSYVSKDSYYLRSGAIQYEMGTPPISQAVGLAEACKHLETIGMENIERHDRALTRYLIEGLRDLDFITVWGDHISDSGLYGLVSLSVFGADAGFIGRILGNMNVAVRSGGHCALPLAASMGLGGTTRISFGIHTTSEDIDAALTALRTCGKLLHQK